MSWSKKLFVVTLLIFQISACAETQEGRCVDLEALENVRKTESLVLYRPPALDNHDVLQGTITYACSLLTFDITDGVATNIRVIMSNPSGRMDRLANRTLSKYRFKNLQVQQLPPLQQYVLLFEIKK